MHEPLRLVFCGDRSLLVYLGATIDPAVNDRVHALTRLLRAKQHPAITEITPAYHCLLVEYDPVRIRPDQLEELVLAAGESAPGKLAGGRTVSVPVRYGDDYGPDMPTVAAHSGLSEAEVVRQHAEGSYRVYCLGFSPGFPYLGGLVPALHTPRLAEPRTRVPAGSVAIGGAQTGMYPAASPGGWQLIGRTPVRLFDPYREPPALLEPGDTVRFEAIDDTHYADLEARETARVPDTLKPEGRGGATGLRVIQPGLATTVQDLGRRGYQQYGVPVAGAADFAALMVGNWLLGNRARTSGLEITLVGPEVEFAGPTAFSLTGAPIPAELIPAGGDSPIPVPLWSTQLAGPGDRLRLGTATAGCRSYLCLAGGIDLPPVLGSLSEDLFGKIGPLGRTLKAGDWLPLGLPLHPPADLAGRSLPPDLIPEYGGIVTVRAVRGPQAGAFTPEAVDQFFRSEYVVSARSDRQGLRLEGPQIAHQTTADILSEPVPAGSIQVPANGQPILLLGNRQTVGGYTKVAVAVYPDLSAASQVRPGDRIRFQEVDAAEAHAVAWAERRKLAQVRRFLERAISHVAETGARLASVPVFTVAPPPQGAAPVVPPVPAPAGVRTYRITILGIEFETTVEEAPE